MEGDQTSEGGASSGGGAGGAGNTTPGDGAAPPPTQGGAMQRIIVKFKPDVKIFCTKSDVEIIVNFKTNMSFKDLYLFL